jgi:thymidylate synthase
MTERQYLNALNYVRAVGDDVTDRTGVGARWAHGVSMKFWLHGGMVPLLQTKKIDWRVPLDELLWFIRGGHSAKELKSKIWDAWAGPDGDLGPIYGVQWRGLGSSTTDQLVKVVDGLKKSPHSRRHVVSAWIPDDIDDMALPPCHTLFQFNVDSQNRLHTSLYMRSGDMFLGVPFNIFEYAVLTHMVSKLTGYESRQLNVYIANAHIYHNHMEQVKEQLKRDPKRRFPKLTISGSQKSIDDFRIDDFEVIGYDPMPRINAPVAV